MCESNPRPHLIRRSCKCNRQSWLRASRNSLHNCAMSPRLGYLELTIFILCTSHPWLLSTWHSATPPYTSYIATGSLRPWSSLWKLLVHLTSKLQPWSFQRRLLVLNPTRDLNTTHGFSMIIPYDHIRQSAFQACRFISMNTMNLSESEGRFSSAPHALSSDACKYCRNIYNVVVPGIRQADNILLPEPHSNVSDYSQPRSNEYSRLMHPYNTPRSTPRIVRARSLH